MKNTMTYITTSEAAKILGLSQKTLEKLRVVGGGPRYRKLGRSVRYFEADLFEWADSQVRTSTSDPGIDAEATQASPRLVGAMQESPVTG